MILGIWNAIRGYVVIEIGGASTERLVNLALHKGLYIWDMRRDGGTLEMKVSIKGFKLLCTCAKKTKSKIRIKRKIGLPFFMFRYRKRKPLMFGAVFFIFVLYFLSSFIWLVQVDGCVRISGVMVAEVCARQGYKTGVFKHALDVAKLEEILYEAFPDISWVNVHIKGTKLVIRLTEALPKAELIDKSVPCDVIASKDGLVSTIVTSTGTPLVKQRDVVKKGDILVSGTTEGGTKPAHAEAEVWAKTYFEINLEIPYEYVEKIYTGREEKGYSLIIMGKNINLLKSGNQFANYDKIFQRNQLKFGESYPLPIVFTTARSREYVQTPCTRDMEAAKELAEGLVTGRALREYDNQAEIVDRAMEYEDMGDRLKVRAVITMLERIDQKREIDDSYGTDEQGA